MGKELKLIYIVDDSSTARMFTKRCLEAVGCQEATFSEYADGEQAWAAILDQAPDLLVTDLNMPNMDGVTLIKNILAHDEAKHTPIVALTSLTNEARVAELTALGVHAVVGKPAKPQGLVGPVQALIRGQEEEEGADDGW